MLGPQGQKQTAGDAQATRGHLGLPRQFGPRRRRLVVGLVEMLEHRRQHVDAGSRFVWARVSRRYGYRFADNGIGPVVHPGSPAPPLVLQGSRSTLQRPREKRVFASLVRVWTWVKTSGTAEVTTGPSRRGRPGRATCTTRTFVIRSGCAARATGPSVGRCLDQARPATGRKDGTTETLGKAGGSAREC
jgi:hypothetical protein